MYSIMYRGGYPTTVRRIVLYGLLNLSWTQERKELLKELAKHTTALANAVRYRHTYIHTVYIFHVLIMMACQAGTVYV